MNLSLPSPTDWANRRRNLAGMKTIKGQQQESTRKRTPPPSNSPSFTTLSKHSSPSPHSWSQDRYNVLARAEKPASCNEDMLRKMLGSYQGTQQIGRSPLELREEQEQCSERHVTLSHLEEQGMMAHLSPKPFIPKDQFGGDGAHGLGLLQRPYISEPFTLDFRIRGKAPLEHSVAGSPRSGEHLNYLPKTLAPHAYLEPLHAVPSYIEPFARHELESPLSLYGEASLYTKSFPHYDYRSPGHANVASAAAAFCTVPDQALASPMGSSDSRLIKVLQ